MPRQALMLFLKAPRPGFVKTRLAERIGAEAAAELQRLMARATLERTEPRAGEYKRLVFFTPEDAREELLAWLPRETLVPQQGGGLGRRMERAFEEAFRRGFERVAVVGTDVPGISRGLVALALRSLETHDLAIGPARDGGYYLMALDALRPTLFRGVRWSTPLVLASTLERAAALGLSVRLLETLRDVDTLDDLRAEWPRVRPLLAASPFAAHIAQALGAE